MGQDSSDQEISFCEEGVLLPAMLVGACVSSSLN